MFLVVKEIKTRIIMKYYYTPTRMIKITKIGNNKCRSGCQATKNILTSLIDRTSV